MLSSENGQLVKTEPTKAFFSQRTMFDGQVKFKKSPWKSASLFPQPQQSYCNKPLAVAARIEVMHGPNSVGCLSSRPI